MKKENTIQRLKTATKAAQNDPWRPRFHFTPPANWMNDPNGTVFYDGVYHLFYQFNPTAPKWGNLHWGHAKSTDLVHWEHLPIALYPDKTKREHHCFSGCCFVLDGQPQIFYTSINGRLGLLNVIFGAQHWRAVSNGSWENWDQPEDYIIFDPKDHPQKIYHWRDPYVWCEGNQ